jgi:hypothetical protein
MKQTDPLKNFGKLAGDRGFPARSGRREQVFSGVHRLWDIFLSIKPAGVVRIF